MKDITLKLNVEDDFEPGNCHRCPLSYLDEQLDHCCALHYTYDNCELTVKE